ncbi:carboxymuconolactone decarboxylase family protein [Amycolatopsis australiensis]|uniref:Alkylhydroperoxidase AhpD family core domain-containing protein n=1 Tax=Amycolatopsis australiensis TaxID=546364 RepID=A0A1K1T5I3_9PSEU|nr:carboxymuconolactone decarboxylase family protein [Amycolatopsis australiensis]SFW91873.1 alkylhydroperoxidase AhpD family core domain-containing protein [Amycolatopsis australiensis]
MTKRIGLGQAPELYQAMANLQAEVNKAGANAGLDPKLLELVKTRASQINGCAYCLDMHSRDALELGESPRRLFVLDGWRETDLFTEQEQAALALTEAMTKLSATQAVPDDVYEQAVKVFTEDQYRAVAWEIIAINSWNRMTITSHTPLPKRDA